MKKILILFAIIAIAGMLFLFTRQTTVKELPADTNKTAEPAGIAKGDLIKINFVLSLENGTIVDTNNAELAKENGIKDYVKGPYTFILGQSGKVQGFDEALLGMKEGEHRDAIISPSEKEIVLTINKTKIIDRFIAMNKKRAFKKENFEKIFSKPAIKGDVVFSEALLFKYKVINATNETAVLEMVVKEGEKYKLPNTQWESKVAKVAEEDVLFYQMPEENQSVESSFGSAKTSLTKSRIYIKFQPELNKIFNESIELTKGFATIQQFQVVSIGENDFVIKRFGALTDKKLSLSAELLSITPEVKKIREKKIISETLS